MIRGLIQVKIEKMNHFTPLRIDKVIVSENAIKGLMTIIQEKSFKKEPCAVERYIKCRRSEDGKVVFDSDRFYGDIVSVRFEDIVVEKNDDFDSVKNVMLDLYNWNNKTIGRD